MAITVYFKKESKRRNSTLQFTLNSAQQFSCVLKSATSVDRPTFLLSATSFDYNLAHWGGRYYFIENITSVRDGQWEVSCSLDALATYKTEILNSSQFVGYSSDSTLKDNMIADTRIPIKKSFNYYTIQGSVLPLPINLNQLTYMLTVNGRTGTRLFICTQSEIKQLVVNISSWYHSLISGFDSQDVNGNAYDFTSIETALQSLGKMLNQSGFLGNAYADAVNNIMNCIALPFKMSEFLTMMGSSNKERIYLGQFDTGVDAYYCYPFEHSHHSPIANFGERIYLTNLPYSDWRRGSLIDYNLALPGVGVIALPSDIMTSLDSLYIYVDLNVMTGQLTYTVDGRQSNDLISGQIGQYSGSLAMTIPIGISQAPSLGKLTQTVVHGIAKTGTALIGSKIGGTFLNTAFTGIGSAYDVLNESLNYNNTSIGAGSGGTGIVIERITLYAIVRELIENQNDFAIRMGYPVQKHMSLSNISGYVQCINAHAAVDAEAGVIDTIDSYLNSGFYIE